MKRVWLVVSLTILVIFILLDLILENGGYVVFPWSHLVGFFALFGFIGCLVLILVAKLLGHYWLQRKEDYYDRDGDNE